MIKLNEISFSYGRNQILNRFSCEFHPGRFYGIFGANGSGKSTLLKLITGELHPDNGTVLPVYNDVMERAKNIAFMEQQSPDMIPLTVRETVELGRYPWVRTNKDFSLDPVLEQLNLLELSERPYTKLSGGEKQRVMLARILAQETPILLLDEPFSSLDFGNQHHFYRILKSLALQGKCVVMITHDIFVSAEYLDEALFLKNGSLFRHGTPEEIFSKELFAEVYHH